MAMGWLRIREDLHEDTTVLRIAAELRTRPEHVVGYCVKFWSWVSRNCHAETVTGVTLESLEDVLHLPGFCALLCKFGWLEYDNSGAEPRITIPKFDRYLSEGSKARALASERQRKKRVTQTSRAHRDKSVTREEKRRDVVTNVTTKGKSQISISDVKFPDGMNTPAVKSAVDSWLSHKRSRGKGYKSAAQVEILIRKWLMAGPLAFIDAIENSIANNYDGVHAGGPRAAANQQHRRETPAEARERSNADAINGFLRASGVREGDDGAMRIEANGEPSNG